MMSINGHLAVHYLSFEDPLNYFIREYVQRLDIFIMTED